MKESPILFSTPMIQAILAGRKSQTRRIINGYDIRASKHGRTLTFRKDKIFMGETDPHNPLCNGSAVRLNPYGLPGDRLWVRETWADLTESHGQKWERYNEQTRLYDRGRSRFVWYRADGEQPMYDGEPAEKWRPSIFMLRSDSRITLEITDVRVQRLRDISGKEILAEGAVTDPHTDEFGRNPVSAFDGKVYLDLISLWAKGWDSINAKKAPFASNPYVWAISFRKVQ